MLIHGVSRLDCAPLAAPYCRFLLMHPECPNTEDLRYY